MVIGFMGYARAGKDTAADAIVRATGWPRIAFADKLKSDLSEIFHRFQIDLNNPEHKKLARPLMVEYGRLARAIDPDHWIGEVDFESGFHKNLVVSDVRYLNEVRWVQNQGGTVICVIRPDHGHANDEEARSMAEILEAERSGIIAAIPSLMNTGTVEELQAKTRRLVAGCMDFRREEA